MLTGILVLLWATVSVMHVLVGEIKNDVRDQDEHGLRLSNLKIRKYLLRAARANLICG